MQVGRGRRLEESVAPADQAGLGCRIGVGLASCFRFWATAARWNSPARTPFREPMRSRNGPLDDERALRDSRVAERFYAQLAYFPGIRQFLVIENSA